MLRTPLFNQIWSVIKNWDIHVPGAYGGYCGANGNHVRAIVDGIDASTEHVEYRFVEGRSLPQSAYVGLGKHGWILAAIDQIEGGKKQWVF
jgi:hypothetical protein